MIRMLIVGYCFGVRSERRILNPRSVGGPGEGRPISLY
jgi:hypothetical protein